MATLKQGHNGVTHSTGPVIGNNIYLNIYNAYSIVPPGQGTRVVSEPPSAKVLGRKLENQVSVHISDSSSLTERDQVREVVCVMPLKKPKGLVLVSTPRPPDAKRAALLTSARQLKSPKDSSDQRKQSLPSERHEKKPSGKVGSPRGELKPELPRTHLGKRTSSDSAFQFTPEIREILGLSEKKFDIPYSFNRFHGKYQEVVPPKYKERKDMFDKERKEREQKKEEAKQRAMRTKTEGEKIRKSNQALFQKPNAAELPLQMPLRPSRSSQKEPDKKAEQKKKTSEERLKEIGLEFILHYKQKVHGTKPEKLFENEQIKAMMKNRTAVSTHKKSQPPEERERRKNLVEDQKKGYREKEIKQKKEKESEEKKLRERLTTVELKQKQLREEVLVAKQVKRKGKKHKRKSKKERAAGVSGVVHINGLIQEGEKAADIGKLTPKPKLKLKSKKKTSPDARKEPTIPKRPATGARMKEKCIKVLRERSAESDTETVKPEGGDQRSNYKKLQREAIARKAEKIREQQSQRLCSPSAHGQQPVMLLPYVPRANPRGLSTSSYAVPPQTSSGIMQPPMMHMGDVTAPAGSHLGEEEKQRMRENWRERMHDLQSKLLRHDTRRRAEDVKEPPVHEEEEKKHLTEPEGKQEFSVPSPHKKPNEGSPGRQFEGLTPKEDANGGNHKDVLSKELERIDEQFEIHGENASERKEVEEFNKEVLDQKRIEKLSAAKEAEDYGHILQSMEEMEKDPLSIQPPTGEENGGTYAANNNTKASEVKETKKEESKVAATTTIKDYDSENEKEEEPQAILYTAKETIKESPEELRLRALEEETRRINDQLRKELAEKDNLILEQALRETKLHKEYQEIIAKQAKELMQKVLEVTNSMQSAHNEQINSVVGKLCDHLEKLVQRAEEPKQVTKSLEPSPQPRPQRETAASEPKRSTAMEPELLQRNFDRAMAQPGDNNDNDRCSFAEITSQKLREVLKDNQENKEIHGKESELKDEYSAKVKELDSLYEKVGGIDAEQHNLRRMELEKWYAGERKRLEAERSRLLVEALKKTANLLERESCSDPANQVEAKETQKEELKETHSAQNAPSKPGDEEAIQEIAKVPDDIIKVGEAATGSAPEEIQNVADIEEVSVRELTTAEKDNRKSETPQEEHNAVPDVIVLEEKKEEDPANNKDEEKLNTETMPEEHKEAILIAEEVSKNIVESAMKEKEEGADRNAPNPEVSPANRNSLDSESRPTSDIEWMLHLDNSASIHLSEKVENVGNMALPVEELKQADAENVLATEKTPVSEQNNLMLSGLSPIPKVSESCTKDESEPLDKPKPDTTTPSATDAQEEKKSMANNIADAIFADLMKGLDDGLFPKRSDKPSIYDLRASLVKAPVYKYRGIKTALWNAEAYVDEVFREVMKDPESFIASLSIPLNRDPLFILGQIQNEDNDYFETIEQIMTQPVLPVELYLNMEHTRKVDSVDEAPKDSQHEALLTEWSNIHNKCIFDAINDALDYYRPYGLKGPPLPWSKQVRELTYRNGSVASTQDVLLGAKAKILAWAMVNSGTLQLPDEFDLASILAQLGIGETAGEKSRLDQCREERLESMLASEVNEIEPTWIDYELEETQVILDVADMILEQLTTESMNILIDAEQKKPN